MGCDIHGWLEQKKDDGGYVAVCDIEPTELGARSYARFAKLAGVRGSGPKPNGLPDDLSDTARLWSKYDDFYHSASWLPANEFIRRCIAADIEEGLAGQGMDEYNYYIRGYDYRNTTQRIVFWFDS